MESARKKEYDTRFDEMETKRMKYENNKARKEWLTQELAGIDDLINDATDDDVKKGLQYDKKQWTAELADIPNIEDLKTAYTEQKKAFDNAERDAKAAAR